MQIILETLKFDFTSASIQLPWLQKQIFNVFNALSREVKSMLYRADENGSGHQ